MQHVALIDTKPFPRTLYCEHKECQQETTTIVEYKSTGTEMYGKDKGKHYVLALFECVNCKIRSKKGDYIKQIQKIWLSDWLALCERLID